MAKSDRDRQLAAERARRVDVETIPSIGPRLAQRLTKAGIETAEDMERLGEPGLLTVSGIGEKIAVRLLAIARDALEAARVTVGEQATAAPPPDAPLEFIELSESGEAEESVRPARAAASTEAPDPSVIETSSEAEAAGQNGETPRSDTSSASEATGPGHEAGKEDVAW